MCAAAGLTRLGRVALDGARIKANASRHKAMSYDRMKEEETRLTREIAELMARADAADTAEDEQFGDRSAQELPEELARRKSRLEKIREARERVLAPARSYQEVSALRAAGASNEEIFVARQNRFGQDAAQRLADLDVAREYWWERFAGYSEQRDDLLAEMAEAEASPGERNAALEALLEQHFEASERRRARALGASFR